MGFNEYYLRNTVLVCDNTIWVSEAMVRKFCGVSAGYLVKARSVYKKAVEGLEVDDLFGGIGGYRLPDCKRAWRWAFDQGGYYYDLERIPLQKPVYYRWRLPSRNEIIAEWEAYVEYDKTEEKSKRRRPRNHYDRAKELQMLVIKKSKHEHHNVYRQGFGRVEVRHLSLTATWILFIRRVEKFGLYCGYGFYDQEDFRLCCTKALIRQKLKYLNVSNIDELSDAINAFPDDLTELEKHLIMLAR